MTDMYQGGGYGDIVPPQGPRSQITRALMQQTNAPPVPPGSMQLPGTGMIPPPTPGMPPAAPGPMAPGPMGAGAAPPIGGSMGAQPGQALPGLSPPGIRPLTPQY